MSRKKEGGTVDFYKLTQELWRIYFAGTPQDEELLLDDWLDPDCVIIGTGKHEIYRSAEAFRAALHEELKEREHIPFQFRDFWCEPMMLSDDVCQVYGEIYICWEDGEKAIAINMDSRFSIVFRRSGEQWKVTHIHHSLPNIEQSDGEYYPKTLLQQYNVQFEEMEHLQSLAERDGLTNLINFRTFQERYKHYVDTHSACWLLVIDVDKFKCINDTYGHMAGNRVLQKMAEVLKSIVRSSDVVCRMGGDEFVLLCSGLETEEQAAGFVRRLKQAIADAGRQEQAWADVSIGRARATALAPLEEVFGVADADLYRDKGSCCR